jgi:hypothetical protein
MIRFLILALLFVPAASVTFPVNAQLAPLVMSQATTDDVNTTDATPDAEEEVADFSPMQEEIIADRHATFSPIVESLWTRLELVPETPLFPIDRGNLFRPPQGIRA